MQYPGLTVIGYCIFELGCVSGVALSHLGFMSWFRLFRAIQVMSSGIGIWFRGLSASYATQIWRSSWLFGAFLAASLLGTPYFTRLWGCSSAGEHVGNALASCWFTWS